MNRKLVSLSIIVALLALVKDAVGFSLIVTESHLASSSSASPSRQGQHHQSRRTPRLRMRADDNDTCESSIVLSRRRVIKAAVFATFLAALVPPVVGAADSRGDDEPQAAMTIWRTGKPPKVPGEKPRDKNDTSGSRKDPRFLRSISDCKSQCENSPGPDGYARAKGDCLSDCQDICCTTYEQCTFAIVPRI
jgi:hypothetical protein